MSKTIRPAKTCFGMKVEFFIETGWMAQVIEAIVMVGGIRSPGYTWSDDNLHECHIVQIYSGAVFLDALEELSVHAIVDVCDFEDSDGLDALKRTIGEMKSHVRQWRAFFASDSGNTSLELWIDMGD